jgi:hypothetical protein
VAIKTWPSRRGHQDVAIKTWPSRRGHGPWLAGSFGSRSGEQFLWVLPMSNGAQPEPPEWEVRKNKRTQGVIIPTVRSSGRSVLNLPSFPDLDVIGKALDLLTGASGQPVPRDVERCRGDAKS